MKKSNAAANCCFSIRNADPSIGSISVLGECFDDPLGVAKEDTGVRAQYGLMCLRGEGMV